MSSIHDMIKSHGIPVHSMDIETTGLDQAINSIWSFGVAADDDTKSFESFIKGVVPQNASDPMDSLMNKHIQDGAKVFAERQKEKKSFDPFIQAHNSGTTENLSETLRRTSEIFKDAPGINLIQNVNFEKQNLAHARGKRGAQGLTPDHIKDFTTTVYGVEKSASPIHIDRNILTAKQKHSSAIADSMKGIRGTATERDSVLGLATQRLESQIANTIKTNVDKNLSTTVDLMDISRIYLSKLHLEGGLDAGFLRSGTSMEYLAHTVLGEEELHTSLRDAKQQKRVFEALVERSSNIDKNGLSDVDKEFIKNLSDPTTDAKAFSANLNSSLQKLGPNATRSQVEKEFEHAIDRRKNVPEGAFSRRAYTNSLLGSFDEGGSLEDLLKITSENKENINIDDFSVKGTESIVKKASDNAPVKAKSWKSKALLGAAAVVGTGLLMTGPRRDVQEFKEDIEQTSYDDLYSNVYAGQAYADWTVRNNSHKMLY